MADNTEYIDSSKLELLENTSLIKNILKPSTKPINELETTVQAIRNGNIQDISSFLYNNDDEKTVSFYTKQSQPDTCVIEIEHIDKNHKRNEKETIEIQGYNNSNLPAGTAKLLIFLFNKIYEQAWSYDNNELKTNRITFKISELINEGVYSDIKKAREEVHTAYEFLNHIRIKGTSRIKNYKTKKWEDLEFDGTPFYHYNKDKNGIITISLSQEMNWVPLLIYFTTMPDLFWQIKGKYAPMLFELIFNRARILDNITPIKENIYGTTETGFEFYISMQKIYETFMLPPTEDTKRNRTATAQIKAPINNAIEKIETAAQQYKEDTNRGSIYLEVEEIERVSIEEWLEKSKLHIKIFGEFAKPFLNLISTKKRKAAISARKKSTNTKEKTKSK